MSLLQDSTGRSLGYIAFDLVAGESSSPVLIFAVASDGASLRSGTSTAFELTARRTGTADPFVSLEDAGIDLSADTPGPVSFDLVAEGLTVSGLVRDAVSLTVGRSGAAGWSA